MSGLPGHLTELGSVNTCFARVAARKNVRARREAQGVVNLWPSFATPHSRFFVRNPEGRDGISPSPSLLAPYRAYSATQLVPCSG
jgi:hypothetical protein